LDIKPDNLLYPSKNTVLSMSDDNQNGIQSVTVPSCVIQDGGSDKDIETFAVMHDFFCKTKESYIDPQKAIFKAFMIFFIFGMLAIISQFVIDLGVNMLYIGGLLILLSICILCFFLLRKPKHINAIQKFYWPFAILSSDADNYKGSFAFDLMKGIEPHSASFDDVDKTLMNGVLKNLPEDLSSFEKEVKARSNITRLQDFRNNLSITSNIVPEPIFGYILNYSIFEKPPSDKTMEVQDADIKKMKDLRDDISKHLDHSHDTIEYVKECEDFINYRLYTYVKHLAEMLEEETDHAIINMVKFLQDSQGLNNIFDPVTSVLEEDLKNDIKLLERIVEMEIKQAEEHLRFNKIYITTLCDQTIEEIEYEIGDQLKKKKKLQKIYEDVKESIYGAEEIMIDMIIDSEKILRALRKEVKRVDRQYYEKLNDKIYMVMGYAQQNANSLEGIPNKYNINERIIDLREKLLHVLKSSQKKVLEVESLLREDSKDVRRHLIRLQDLEENYDNMVSEIERMLFEEIERHRAPIQDRIDFFAENKIRIDNEFEEIIGKCNSFSRSYEKTGFSINQEIVCHIPFWKIDYHVDGVKYSKVYGLSQINDNGMLIPMYYILNMDEKWFNQTFDEVLSEDIDKNLIEGINSSAYYDIYKPTLLNRMICKMGVKKLAKR